LPFDCIFVLLRLHFFKDYPLSGGSVLAVSMFNAF
jgi:hypothetical protein